MLTASLLSVTLLGGAPQDTVITPPSPDSVVHRIRIDGPITPVTTNYIERAIALGESNGVVALVIELDTPGGLLESTQNIIGAFFGADLPIVVYVAPDGARAASAGTFITLAAHVAAMAPSTTIGAASPVSMSPGAQTDTVMQRKVFNAAASLMETIAERRDRDVEWAIAAVREGASATEREALERGVIDLIVDDLEDLLRQADGRVAEDDTLRTAAAGVVDIPPNAAERFLGLIIRPELMLILMLVAIYGIIGELTNPGAIVPGTAGVIALILLMYASAAMPINAAGFLLLGLAIALFIAEAFTPTFGILLGAGTVAFFLGALMVFQELPEPVALPWIWLVPATLLTTAFFALIAGAGIKAQFTPARTGIDAMIGQKATVIAPVGPDGGKVFAGGTYWNAVATAEIPSDQPCRIEAVDGLTLTVRPLTGSDGPEPEPER